MKLSDRLIGLILLVFGAAVLVEARSFPVIPGQSIGSGLLPSIVAIGLIGCALILIAKDLVTAPRAPLTDIGDWISDPLRLARLAVVLLGTAAFLPLLDVVGFPALSITVLVLFMLFLQVKPLTAVLVAIGASFAIHMLFSKLFLVPLPWGILEFMAW